MTPLVSNLWPQFMVDPAFAACFGQVIVEHAQMLRQERQVIFTLRSGAPLDKNLCARLLASLQPDYEGFELRIQNLFGYAMLDEAALRDLMEEMKRDGVPINGFLDRCKINIIGQKITIGVCHGTKFLQEMHFEKLLAERIAAHTGVTPQITLQSAVSEAEQHQMEEKLERKIAPPVVKFEKKNTAPSIKVDGLDLTDKPVTIFHGKMFTPKNLTPLKDLGGEGGKCTIWGDVFFSEVKGNFRKIYTVSITDYQGSINLKIRAQEGEDCSKWESLGKGTTLIVRGDCSYDKYEHDYIVYPYDVLIVERKKREDTAPVKRVELHLHTKLSSMDGFCDPGGMVVVPDTYEIYDFCPIQHPADDVAGGLLTTHFEFKYLHDTLLKLDELGHDMPTFYKYFEEYTGIPIDSIPMNDPKVYSLLTSPEALGVTPEQIDSQTGTFGIPEMGTNFVRGMLVEARPKNFSELIQISGLSHGTDVWTGNADELIRSGTCTIAEVIGCRDSIMLYLLRKGLEPKMAFDIMEAVRKGKVAKGGFKDGWEEAMREHEVPDWYIESCRKIKYMFPKAHAVAYLMSAIRLMWFKIYRPPEFYAVYFTVRGDDIDYEAAVGGAAVARAHMEEVKRRLKEEKNAKDEDVLVSLQLVNEMLVRGYEFLPIELGKSRGSKYVVEDGKVRLPFSSLKGLGGAAADALEKVTIHGEEYISVEELQQASGVGSSILDRLRQVGALGDLPESSQVSFF